MTLKPATKLGPYEVLGPLGAGGMGEVYRARDERLSRDVAIKVLPASFLGEPEKLLRFTQEARATGQLNHPNILAVYDTGTHEGMPYVEEELLEGETLRQKMGGAPLPPRKAIDYAGQIARGLAAAHQKGIVHRDLKPENLFVTPDGRVKILDFGLAKLVLPEGASALLSAAPTQAETGAGVVLGTIGYMSPEQVRGQPVDHRSDIFSFGSVLYEMITGRRPFVAGSSIETMNAILKEDPPEISKSNQDLPPGLDRIVQHCLEKSADERFQSARDLAFQIDALSSASSAMAAGRQMEARAPTLRTRPVIAVAVIVAALAVGVLAGRMTRRAPPTADYQQLTYRQGSLASARFTPDGETVVYGAAWDGGPIELYSTRSGSPESRSLGLPPADILSVSSSGEMAVLLDPHFTLGFERSGTLARAPLAGGVPRQVLENVQDADWSPDGQGMAVARAGEGRYQLEYPIGKVLYETSNWIGSLRFSRDGKWIAFLDHPRSGDNRGRVAIVDLSGKMKPLTEMFSASEGLVWSPSGAEIWFTAAAVGNVSAIHAVDLSGHDRVVQRPPAGLTLQDITPTGKVLITRNTMRRGMTGLPPGEKIERDLSWLDWSRPSDLSADGQWLLFEEQGQGGGPNYSIYLRKTDGSPAVKLGEGFSMALSPDGQWAVTGGLETSDQIVLLPRGPGGARTLPIRGLNATKMRWHPDGKRLVFEANEAGHLSRLYTLDLQGGTPKPITPETPQSAFAIAPDGGSVAVSSKKIAPRIVPIDGGDPRPIPGTNPADIVLGFHRDGDSIFVGRVEKVAVKVDRVELRTGRRTPWKELLPTDRAGLLDISWILFSGDGQSYVYSYRRILSTLYLGQGLQ